MPLAVGLRLGPYEIQGLLGAGGMGEVYRARDTRLDRTVAIKVLTQHGASDPTQRERFNREARVISSLDHPNICALYDVGEHQGAAYLVMQYLEGQTLAERITKGALPVDEAIGYAIQIAAALAKAHQLNVVHRDLKPRNVIITETGAKLLDFGVAKLLSEPGLDAPTIDVGQTAPGVPVGTARYMSPEQARGRAVDARSDLFSFGVLLYESLAARPPFEGATYGDLLIEIVERQPAPLSSRCASIPAELERLIAKCLEKDPAKRYASAQELAAELAHLKGGSTGSVPAAKSAPSIAVLPFVNMSADPENEYFCDGVAEDLINALAKIGQLHVAARTSTFSFKGKSGDLREIGRALNVSAVLEGSVRKAGARLRVAVQLVNVADGYQVWAERYDRQLEDVFAIQDEITLAIVEALKVKLLSTEKAALLKRHTDNVEAYQYCLRARHSWHKWTNDAFIKALEFFEKALEIDPDYAPAHFGVGDCYVASSNILPMEGARAKIKTSLETALRLDPELAEAHGVYGIHLALNEWNWTEAEKSCRTAYSINPRSAHVSMAHSVVLLARRAGEAVEWGRKGVALDPLAPFWHVGLVQAYVANRQYEEALRQVQTALELEARYWFAHLYAGMCHAALGRTDEAVAALERAVEYSGGASYAIGHLGYALARAGRREEAAEKLRELLGRPREGVLRLSLATVYAGLGQVDEALVMLAESTKAHEGFLTIYLSGGFPAFDSLRGDPRFAELVRKVGLEG